MARQLYRARLENKIQLSETTQCFHLEFSVPALESLEFLSGQFISAVAVDKAGKNQTRAYSIASAPRSENGVGRFDLCVNRVEGGFFSNLLCDLEPGQEIEFHGPHGLFTLRKPLTDCIFIGTGTGIAPMRGFTQWLFPTTGPDAGLDRSEGRNIWLVYGTRHASDIYYEDYFEEIAKKHPNFKYCKTLSRALPEWEGLRGYVQEHVGNIVQTRKATLEVPAAPALEVGPYDIYAYICGLNEMVNANREMLESHGWQRKQVVFERYD